MWFLVAINFKEYNSFVCIVDCTKTGKQCFAHLRWWQWLLWHCRWSLTKRNISAIFVYNLPRLHTSNVYRSNKQLSRRGKLSNTPAAYLQRCKSTRNACPGYNTKLSNDELPSRLGLKNTLTTPLQRGKTPPMSVLNMTQNNLMVRF